MVIPTKKAIKKSHLIEGVAKIVNIDEYSVNGAKYEITYYSNSNDAMYYANDEDLELIEQDTKEETPTDEEIETDTSFEDTPKQKESLDYEKEYNRVLEENQQLRQENESMRDIISMMGDLL
jgi:2,3-bisphosphoglycerate-independent phosphoglycerate mutase